jgi:curved DNA-binding protein CbpA
MLANREVRPSAYDLLAVDPNAPSELIATSYWSLVGRLQRRREQGEYVDGTLHEITRAYECVSDADRRAGYDAAIGHTTLPLSKRPLPRFRRPLRSRLLRRPWVPAGIDQYEVMGISRDAPADILPAAFHIMRDQYLRIPASNKKRTLLLTILDESYATISSVERREKYDQRTRRKTPPKRDVPAAGGGARPDGDAAAQTSSVAPMITTPASEPSPGGKAVEEASSEQAMKPAGTSAGRRVLGVVRAAALVPVAVIRLLYRGTRGTARRLSGAFRDRATRQPRASGPEAPAPQPQPILREPPPRPRAPDIDVEEALLGRLASSVKETQSQPRAGRHERNAKMDASELRSPSGGPTPPQSG